jgi:orotate phosphoribosyltransferase
VSEGARYQLLDVLRRGAVLHGEFVLSSGRRSTHYIDARLVTLSAEGSVLVGQVFCDLLRDVGVDAAAGLAIGADPIVTAIALTSSSRERPIDGLIVRKERKQHGTGHRIEGPFRSGMRVAVVDDTFTTGASALSAAEAIAEAGGDVVGVFALIDREEGARQAIESAGYRFTSVFLSRELVDPEE